MLATREREDYKPYRRVGRKPEHKVEHYAHTAVRADGKLDRDTAKWQLLTTHLRKLTEEAIAELHRLVRGFQIADLRFQTPALPPAVFKPACEEGSLYAICLAQVTGAAGGVARAAHRLFEI
jgi:hypothetical protein